MTEEFSPFDIPVTQPTEQRGAIDYLELAKQSLPENHPDHQGAELQEREEQGGALPLDPQPEEPVIKLGDKALEYTQKIIRQKQAMRAERQRDRQAIQEREKAFEAKQKELDEFAKLKELAKTDPYAAHELLGVDHKAFIAAILKPDQENMTPEEKIQSVEDRLNAILKKQEEDQIAAEKKKEDDARHNLESEQETYVSNYQNIVLQEAAKDEHRYQLIKEFQLQNRVWNTALSIYEMHGVMPHPTVVMNIVETDIRNELKPLFSKRAFMDLMTGSQETLQDPNGSRKATSSAHERKPASLSNRNAKSSSLASPSKKEEELTKEEKEARAVAALQRAMDEAKKRRT